MVRLVISALTKQKPTGYQNILQVLKRQIETALSKENVIVETTHKPKEIKNFEKYIIAKTHAKKVIYKINPEIVFGAKITHGDWIYDATLDAKLRQLIVNGN